VLLVAWHSVMAPGLAEAGRRSSRPKKTVDYSNAFHQKPGAADERMGYDWLADSGSNEARAKTAGKAKAPCSRSNDKTSALPASREAGVRPGKRTQRAPQKKSASAATKSASDEDQSASHLEVQPPKLSREDLAPAEYSGPASKKRKPRASPARNLSPAAERAFPELML
jgi:hypothetical protein